MGDSFFLDFDQIEERISKTWPSRVI